MIGIPKQALPIPLISCHSRIPNEFPGSSEAIYPLVLCCGVCACCMLCARAAAFHQHLRLWCGNACLKTALPFGARSRWRAARNSPCPNHRGVCATCLSGRQVAVYCCRTLAASLAWARACLWKQALCRKFQGRVQGKERVFLSWAGAGQSGQHNR